MSIDGDFVYEGMNELLYVYHAVYSLLFSSLSHCHIFTDCCCILNLLSHIILFHITVKKTLSAEGKVGKVSDGYILIRDIRG